MEAEFRCEKAVHHAAGWQDARGAVKLCDSEDIALGKLKCTVVCKKLEKKHIPPVELLYIKRGEKNTKRDMNITKKHRTL